MEFRNQEDKRVIVCRAVSLSLLFAVVIFVLIYVGYRLQSLAWFASSKNATATGLSVVAKGPDYELLIDRTNEYDDPKYDGVDRLKAALSSDSYNLTATTTEVAPQLGYELRNELSYQENGVDYKSLTPGSCGTLTFYLKPYNGDVNLTFDLSYGYYFHRYDEYGDPVIEKGNDTAVLDLLHGHILFFYGRTGADPMHYAYTDLLDGGTFTYDTSEHVKCTTPGKTDYYEITLYWEWVMTYDEVVTNLGTKYPSALGDFVSASPECFFATNQDSTDVDELNDGYNDGDQTIGDHAEFIVAYITPRSNS